MHANLENFSIEPIAVVDKNRCKTAEKCVQKYAAQNPITLSEDAFSSEIEARYQSNAEFGYSSREFQLLANAKQLRYGAQFYALSEAGSFSDSKSSELLQTEAESAAQFIVLHFQEIGNLTQRLNRLMDYSQCSEQFNAWAHEISRICKFQ
jgi:hypothetical protein